MHINRFTNEKLETTNCDSNMQRGIVISLMSPKDISSIYPHNRIIGPLTMPFSKKTLSQIELLENLI